MVDDTSYTFAVVASTMMKGEYLRKEFRFDIPDLEATMQDAVSQLYTWHGKEVSPVILRNIDHTKAREWLEKQVGLPDIETNTGFKATNIVKSDGEWYVLSTWLDPKTKTYQVKYASIKQYGYLDALRIAVLSRCKALEIPVPNISEVDAEQGTRWLKAQQ